MNILKIIAEKNVQEIDLSSLWKRAFVGIFRKIWKRRTIFSDKYKKYFYFEINYGQELNIFNFLKVHKT